MQNTLQVAKLRSYLQNAKVKISVIYYLAEHVFCAQDETGFVLYFDPSKVTVTSPANAANDCYCCAGSVIEKEIGLQMVHCSCIGVTNSVSAVTAVAKQLLKLNDGGSWHLQPAKDGDIF
jgi:hypothetical protein